MILCLRTDKPEAEIALVWDGEVVQKETWQAHRQLAATLHQKVKESLQKVDSDISRITGVVVYRGPGSFTGLRIGIAVANALSDSLAIPVVGSSGDDWMRDGLSEVKKADSSQKVVPVYGRGAHITRPRK
ncbi:MAG: tRNA (adenosine(37)-N6)-threonylcarbamoyltransferase complex dimerization subunit type 1 TsaB [Candidatus Saccharibacteria bacterium]|nr:tRNA (adenosine(37)-N6)-threonylcarbamoyltransferase complex dimerization subunit type 1 TsaB [Candidatus Saccharibacteria bacterium]